jgi:predicted ester cyclase
MSEVEENKERSWRLYFEVFGNGNYAAADELMASACVSHAARNTPQGGTDGIKRQAVLLRTAIPDLHVTLHEQVAEGDRVASRWTGSGTHTGPLQLPTGTIGPTVNHISFDEIRIDRHVRGRIAESWFIPDRFTLWQQFGLLPRMDASSQ